MKLRPLRVPLLLSLIVATGVSACATDGSFDMQQALAIVSPRYRAELADKKREAEEKVKEEEQAKAKAAAEKEAGEKVAAEKEAAEKADRAAVDPEKAGKIFFTQQPTGKFVPGRGLEKTDGETYVEEYELGEPLYARAFFFGYGANAGKMSIRYSIDGQVFAEEDMREFWKNSELQQQNQGSGGVSSAGASYYTAKNTAAIPLISTMQHKWVNGYQLHEETLRMLLSRLKGKVAAGKTMTLKVELFQTNRFADEKKETDGAVFAVGEVKVKVTAASAKLANTVCRGGEEGMKDTKLAAELADAFKFAYGANAEKVHKVVINDRDFQITNDRRTGAVRGRFVRAAIIWEAKDGGMWTAHHAFWFPFEGTGFAEKAKLDSFSWNVPTVSLCSTAK